MVFDNLGLSHTLKTILFETFLSIHLIVFEFLDYLEYSLKVVQFHICSEIDVRFGWWHFLLPSSQIIPFPVAGAGEKEAGGKGEEGGGGGRGGKRWWNSSDVIRDSFAH